MGYTNRGSITDFWPDDTDTKMYIEDGSFFDCSIADIIEKAKEKWGKQIDLDKVLIRPENIHTTCIYYDAYDPSDYTDFIVLEYNK